MSHSITTLCLNPALDVTYHVDQLIADQKSRSDAARHDPGGNGINVGRALKRLNIESHTFCVIAGAVGEIFKTLLNKQLDNVFYEEVSGETRINSTIIEVAKRQQFQVTDSGTTIPHEQLNKVIDDFVNMAQDGFGIITGSLQPGVPTGLYARLIERINANGGRAVIDSHGDILNLAMASKPFLIKPNQYELETLLNTHLHTVEQVAQSARKIQTQGIEHVCVSMGAKGAILVSPDNTRFAPALDVVVNTTVGAGDSMVAGLVAGFNLHQSADQALRYGIACGAGTVMHPGTELFSGPEIADFMQRVEMKLLDI